MKDDTVSRAAVLKAIDEYERLSMVSQTVRNMTSLREIVQWLPAVQTCDDAVSRQAAIDALSTPHGILYPIRTVEELPAVQPSVSDCWGCNCPKMERAKEQKTFSEMVHLHDDETHDKRTETHARDLISRQAAIDFVDAGHLVSPNEPRWSDNEVVAFLKSRPSVQPQQIVRCKDCKWSDISAMGHLAVCNHAKGLVNPSPNSYCNFAERRTDEQIDQH